MKVLIVSEDFYPTSGGIAQWAFGVAVVLKHKGYDVSILSRKNILNQFDNQSYKFNIIKFPTWQWKNLKLLYIYSVLLFTIFKNRDDVIITTTWELANISRKFKLKKQKLVTVYHGLEVTKKLSSYRLSNLKKAFLNSELNIAVSRFTNDSLISIVNSTHNLKIINNGVDVNRFKPTKPNPDLIKKYNLQNKRVILTLSRVIERKGHDVVIKALPKVLKNFPDVVYLIAGVYHQKCFEKLKKIIDELNLSKYVIFTGKLNQEELSDYYNLCEFYIMVSKSSKTSGNSEGFGITYLEANACQKAVIGSKTDGIVDAIDYGLNGILVPPDDIEQTAEAICKFLANRKYVQELGENGLKRVKEKFTWEKITEQIIENLK